MRITILALLISIAGYSQMHIIEQGHDHTVNPVYLLVYNTEEQGLEGDFAVSVVNNIVSKSVLFETTEQLLAFLNDNPYSWTRNNRKEVAFGKDKIVGIWNLTTANKIQVELKKQTNFKEKEVVVEREEWVDKWYEIKQ